MRTTTLIAAIILISISGCMLDEPQEATSTAEYASTASCDPDRIDEERAAFCEEQRDVRLEVCRLFREANERELIIRSATPGGIYDRLATALNQRCLDQVADIYLDCMWAACEP